MVFFLIQCECSPCVNSINIYFFSFFFSSPSPQLIPRLLKYLKLFQLLAKKNNGRELFLFANLYEYE